MGVLLESQTLLLVLKKAEVPQNLLDAWIVAEDLWNRDKSQATRRTSDGVALTFHDDWAVIRKRVKEVKLDYPCWFRPFIVHWLRFVSVERQRNKWKFTFACKFSFKTDKIVEGDLSLIFATIPPTFGSDDEGKSFSKATNKSIVALNFLFPVLDTLLWHGRLWDANFNALSATINILL
jgi:hypothetical protein